MKNKIENTNADEQNADYWQMLCGSMMARDLGATDFTHRSLSIFDTFYMSYYSYVYDWLPLTAISGKDVLEVGLGYGTISQQIAAARTRYIGLDVASGPVDLVNKRLELFGLPGEARQGSILEAPFEDESFDVVVAFGCLHHTGDIQKALKEVSRILRPNGQLVMMVYYAYSYRMIYQRRLGILKEMFADFMGKTNYGGDPAERALYDVNDDGIEAPHTVFVSKRQLRRMAKAAGLDVMRTQTENCAQEPPFSKITRERGLKTYARYIGGDLYAILKKQSK
jgi:SAM-dependent methyltransferase